MSIVTAVVGDRGVALSADGMAVQSGMVSSLREEKLRDTNFKCGRGLMLACTGSTALTVLARRAVQRCEDIFSFPEEFRRLAFQNGLKADNQWRFAGFEAIAVDRTGAYCICPALSVAEIGDGEPCAIGSGSYVARGSMWSCGKEKALGDPLSVARAGVSCAVDLVLSCGGEVSNWRATWKDLEGRGRNFSKFFITGQGLEERC